MPVIRDEKVVAIAARDPNLDVALIQVVATFHGGDETFLLRTASDWETLPSSGLWWIFIDCGMVDREIVNRLRDFEHVVLFNYKGNERRVDALFEPVSGKAVPAIVKIDHLLTESLLKSQYGRQILSRGTVLIDIGEVIHRVRSIGEGQYQTIYTGPVLRSAALQDFLNLLVSGLIGEDYGTLSRTFVSTSSTVKIPHSQKLTTIPLSELMEALDILRARSIDPSSAGKGCVLVGKKGAGKSTLAYYLGRTLDKEGKALCIGVDYTLERDFALLGRLQPLLSSFEEYCPRAKDLALPGYPQTVEFMAREYLQNIIRDRRYSEIAGMSPEARNILMLESDRGFIIHMYCYYELSGRYPEEVFFGYDTYTNLVARAEAWYDHLKYDQIRLFAMYLNFLLNRESKEGFASYTYRAILRYVLSIQEHSESAVRAVEKVSQNLGLSSIFAQSASAEQLLTQSIDLPIRHLRKFVLEVLCELKGGRPLLFLIDNLDQRTSATSEARAIHDALKLFKNEINDRFPDARAIISMRDTTLHSQEWMSTLMDITKDWKHVEMLPPDLISTLKKRCIEWQQRGINIGGKGYRRSMKIVTWITEMPTVPRMGEDDRGLGLVDIIQHRHPFNVGAQLRTFAKCCENVILHREWQSEQKNRAWPEKSYEFFVRVFLLGESRFFSEEHSELPNLFDNGFPNSPFNACIRSWLLLSLEKNKRYTESDLTNMFIKVRVPEAETVATVKVLERYELILRLPSPDEQKLVLSIWGEYFREKIGYDLPYISAVWWTTSMLSEFSLGETHEVLPSELRNYAGIFLRWLNLEEELATSKANFDELKVPSIFERVSTNICWSLRKIEMVI